MIDAHPRSSAASPQAPVTDWFIGDDWHHNGALQILRTCSISCRSSTVRGPCRSRSSIPTSSTKPRRLRLLPALRPAQQGQRQATSRARRPTSKRSASTATTTTGGRPATSAPHIKQIKPAVLTVGGWYDAENLFGALEVYRNLLKNSPSTDNRIVMGPWVHGGWSRGDGSKLGDVRFNAPTAEFYQRDRSSCRSSSIISRARAIRASEGLGLRDRDQPLAEVRELAAQAGRSRARYYFPPAGKLSTAAPSQSNADEADEYVSDPAQAGQLPGDDHDPA